ncbi:hypothetical protein IFM89_010461 [Coptis chinensis]|uniref:Water stress and hypersensitive response domain-containing protein n=1 Tax=Coptis chinensis TaxID=261450 RepID=A0A835LXI8_9MAGN|nr:hypothetical protein IFM89_010461 [Coptis chinensis]
MELGIEEGFLREQVPVRGREFWIRCEMVRGLGAGWFSSILWMKTKCLMKCLNENEQELFKVMASLDKPVKKEGEEKGEEGGLLGRVKDFIHDVGEKIEEAVGFGKPTPDVSAFKILSIDLKTAELQVEVLINNPNPIPIPLVDINYLIESNGRKLVSGLIPDTGTIHAHGSETVKIPLKLIYDDIKSTYSNINAGDVIPYKVKTVPVFSLNMCQMHL